MNVFINDLNAHRRVQAQQKLRENDNKLLQALDTNGDGIIQVYRKATTCARPVLLSSPPSPLSPPSEPLAIACSHTTLL